MAILQIYAICWSIANYNGGFMQFIKNKKFISLFTLVIILVTIFSIIYIKNKNSYPPEVLEIANHYLTLVMADNYKDALELCYFKEENEEAWKRVYLDSQFPTTLSYKIKKIISINENLYEITILYEEEKEYVKGPHYVGFINGKWYFIINQRDIPDSIRENFPLQKDVLLDESDREVIRKPSLLPYRQNQQ